MTELHPISCVTIYRQIPRGWDERRKCCGNRAEGGRRYRHDHCCGVVSGPRDFGWNVGWDGSRRCGERHGGLAGAVFSIGGTAIGYKKGHNSGGLVTQTDDGMVIHQAPYFSLIAVSEKNMYAWHVGHKAKHRTAGEVLFMLPRAEIEVEVHVRATGRTF